MFVMAAGGCTKSPDTPGSLVQPGARPWMNGSKPDYGIGGPGVRRFDISRKLGNVVLTLPPLRIVCARKR